MVTIFCRLERIGGISGKRVQIKRINRIIFPHQICFEIKSDVLKMRDEMIDLDRFIEVSKEQTITDDNHYNGYLDKDDTLVLLEYEKGVVNKFGLIKIKDIAQKIPSLDLKKGNYPFTINGLNAVII